MKQRVIVLGSNPRVIEVAKKHDLEVVLVQTKAALTPRDIQLADTVFMLDYKNQELLHRVLLPFVEMYPVIGVTTFSEEALVPAAHLAQALNVEFNPLDVVYLLKDKYRMREHLQANHFHNIAYQKAHRLEEVLDFADRHEYPVIVKPIAGTASEGILKLESQEQAQRLVPAWIAQAHPSAFLIEEYLDGVEISVETFSYQGRHQVLTVTDKIVRENFVEIGHSTPSQLPTDRVQEIEQFVQAFLDCIGLQFGPTHTELKVGSKGIKVIESHNRIGGDGISQLIRLVTGVDLVEWTFQGLKGDADFVRYAPDCGGAAVRFLDLAPGVVTAMSFADEAWKNDPDIYQYHIQLQVGDQVQEITNSRDRRGFVMVKGETPQRALDRSAELLVGLGIELMDLPERTDAGQVEERV